MDHAVRGAVPGEPVRPGRRSQAADVGERGVPLVGLAGAELLALDHPERRAFFRESLRKLAREVTARTERRVATARYFRPPGAGPELAFLAACTRCGACIDICPVHAITRLPAGEGLAAGSPVLEPSRRACVACADMPCAVSCPTGALQVPSNGWAGIHLGRLALDPERCITFHGSACGVCARACPVGERALAMDPGGHPVLKPEGCVGCGLCVTACVTYPSSLTLSLIEERS